VEKEKSRRKEEDDEEEEEYFFVARFPAPALTFFEAWIILCFA